MVAVSTDDIAVLLEGRWRHDRRSWRTARKRLAGPGDRRVRWNCAINGQFRFGNIDVRRLRRNRIFAGYRHWQNWGGRLRVMALASALRTASPGALTRAPNILVS